jgi:hypothetical protein
MITLYTNDDFNQAKSYDRLPCKCEICDKIFYKTKREIIDVLRNKKDRIGKYCSNKCKRSQLTVKCSNCGKLFHKTPSAIKKTNHNFCSQSCSATYQNTHKTVGSRRSKLESYLEEQLTILYPELEIHYNRKDAINSELDIYIPSLKLAFELNGIFHYEPIFGEGKLQQIQNNDQRKFQACIEQGIEMCIIDSSSFEYFKINGAVKYLHIITTIINNKISKNNI